jgi:gluconokinase
MLSPTSVVLVMGVSGSGKSTVGAELARALDAVFVEADAYHPPSNREKMRAAVPLTDQDRAPWLAAIRLEMDRHPDRKVVLACSALKRAYRHTLLEGRPHVIVFLCGSEELLTERLLKRTGHFVGPNLLPSQMATLEPPEDSEGTVVRVRLELTTKDQLKQILAALL